MTLDDKEQVLLLYLRWIIDNAEHFEDQWELELGEELCDTLERMLPDWPDFAENQIRPLLDDARETLKQTRNKLQTSCIQYAKNNGDLTDA